jgi:hypothetical protein
VAWETSLKLNVCALGVSICKVWFEENHGIKKISQYAFLYIQITCVTIRSCKLRCLNKCIFFFRRGSVRVIRKSRVSIHWTQSAHPLLPTNYPDRWVSAELNCFVTILYTCSPVCLEKTPFSSPIRDGDEPHGTGGNFIVLWNKKAV